MPHSGGFAYPTYGTGNAHNTWYACTMVDANGKEIPWVDRDGKVLKTVSERYHHAPGQKAIFNGPNLPYEIQTPRLIPDLPERIRKGEYVLPLYADLPGMPEHERRAIWGLMIPHEGKCKIIYDTYQAGRVRPRQGHAAGQRHAARQATSSTPTGTPWGRASGARGPAAAGCSSTGTCRTNLEGLYVAGTAGYAGGNHAGSASTGRYAARKAAAYVHTVGGRVGGPRAGGEGEGAGLRAGDALRRDRLEGAAGRTLPHHAGLLRRVQERRRPSRWGSGGWRASERAKPPEPTPGIRTSSAQRCSSATGAHHGGRDDDAGLVGAQGQQQGPGLQPPGLSRSTPRSGRS